MQRCGGKRACCRESSCAEVGIQGNYKVYDHCAPAEWTVTDGAIPWSDSLALLKSRKPCVAKTVAAFG